MEATFIINTRKVHIEYQGQFLDIMVMAKRLLFTVQLIGKEYIVTKNARNEQ